MEKYYIALYKLGIKNELLLKAITEYDSDFIIHLFEGNTDIFLTNIEWLEYKNIFEDHSSLLNALLFYKLISKTKSILPYTQQLIILIIL